MYVLLHRSVHRPYPLLPTGRGRGQAPPQDTECHRHLHPAQPGPRPPLCVSDPSLSSGSRAHGRASLLTSPLSGEVQPTLPSLLLARSQPPSPQCAGGAAAVPPMSSPAGTQASPGAEMLQSSCLPRTERVPHTGDAQHMLVKLTVKQEDSREPRKRCGRRQWKVAQCLDQET